MTGDQKREPDIINSNPDAPDGPPSPADGPQFADRRDPHFAPEAGFIPHRNVVDEGAATAPPSSDPSLRNENASKVAPSNLEKDPDDWASGDDPMTDAQRSYLKTLCDQAAEPDLYADDISKAEASKRIDALKAKMAMR